MAGKPTISGKIIGIGKRNKKSKSKFLIIEAEKNRVVKHDKKYYLPFIVKNKKKASPFILLLQKHDDSFCFKMRIPEGIKIDLIGKTIDIRLKPNSKIHHSSKSPMKRIKKKYVKHHRIYQS